MGTKKGAKNVTTVVPDQAPVIVDGSAASRSHSSKPSFQEWKLFMVKLLLPVHASTLDVNFPVINP